jgi:hypothetical protein
MSQRIGRHPHGEVAILIRNEIHHRQAQLPSNNTLETVCMRISATTVRLLATSLYLNPSCRFPLKEFTDLFNTTEAAVATGGLNAKHSAWHSRVGNLRGNQLRLFCASNNIEVHSPQEPTRHWEEGRSD